MARFDKRQLATAEALVHLDGWNNILTGLGQAKYDKRLASTPDRPIFTYPELLEVYRVDAIAARFIDLLPDEMTREWCDILIGKDQQAQDDLKARTEELAFQSEFNWAMKMARLTGGSVILLGVNDGQEDLTQPLNEDNIVSFDWINVFDMREVWPARYYDHPLSPKFGQVEIYQLMPHSTAYNNLLGPDGKELKSIPNMLLIHESRLLRFDGVRLARWQQLQNHGWGDSVLVRTIEAFRDFDTTWGNVSALLHDFSLNVYKIQGLAELVMSNQDEVVKKRMELIELQKSVLRAVLIDNEEEFERKPTPFTQLPELLDRFANRLAAITSTPVTLLFGQAPAGLNATGEQDGAWWNNNVKAQQTNYLQPKLEKAVRLLLKTQNGPAGGMEPDNWTIKFRPLVQMTEQQIVDLRAKQAQTDNTYVTIGVLDPDEVAHSRFGPNGYSIETNIDWEAREAMELAAQEQQLALQDPMFQSPDGLPLAEGGEAPLTDGPTEELPPETDPEISPEAVPGQDPLVVEPPENEEGDLPEGEPDEEPLPEGEEPLPEDDEEPQPGNSPDGDAMPEDDDLPSTDEPAPDEPPPVDNEESGDLEEDEDIPEFWTPEDEDDEDERP